MKVIVFIFSVITILFSCRTNKMTGLYGRCGRHYLSCAQVYIKENYEFEYFTFWDVGGVIIRKGKWENHNDTLVLNTFYQYKDRIVEIIEKQDSHSEFTTIELFNTTDSTPESAFVYLNDAEKPLIIHGKLALTTSHNPKRLSIIFFLEPGEVAPHLYDVKNRNSNHFIIKTKTVPPFSVLTNVKFLYKNNRLYHQIKESNEFDKHSYMRRERLGRKQF